MSRYQEAALGMSEWERWQGGYEVDLFTALEMPRTEDDETYGDDGPWPPTSSATPGSPYRPTPPMGRRWCSS